MKKFILSALVAVVAISANAQYWVGGEISLTSNKEDKNVDATTTFIFAPEVGYKFNDKLGIGVNLKYKSNAIDETGYYFYDDDADGESSDPAYFGLGVFARYNYAKTGIATFFVDGGIGFQFWNNSIGTDFSIGIRPGVSIAASEKINLVTKLGYIGYKKYSNKRGGGSDLGIGIDNTDISFGVLYNF